MFFRAWKFFKKKFGKVLRKRKKGFIFAPAKTVKGRFRPRKRSSLDILESTAYGVFPKGGADMRTNHFEYLWEILLFV